MNNNNWTVTYDGFNKKEHPLHEALCTLGNGYFATRGALETEKNKSKNGNGKEWNYPGTYLAGGYNRRKSKVKDKTIENEDLVNWPNWLYLTFKIDNGKWFDIEDCEILEYKTHLHLKEAILERKIKIRDKRKRETSIISRRIVSMDNHHAAAIQWKFTAENWDGELTIRSGIDGNIINNNVERYSDLNQDHIEVLDKGAFEDNSIYLLSHTKQSQILVAQAAKTNVYSNSKKLDLKPVIYEEKDFIAKDINIKCKKGQTITIEKITALYNSRDMAIADPLNEAKALTRRIIGFDQLLKRHKIAWEQIWKFNDISIKTSEDIDQLILRLHILHLYQTVSQNSIDKDIGIPARGWHGEAYRGHIFWDELYIQPYINLHDPQLSRSLLMYRYRRLPQAKVEAEENGFKGALFPWQSGSNGREETQTIHLNPKSGRWLPDVSHLQYHINAAVPYNVWQYYQSTGDMDFLLSHGAEIILSTALFWSSITKYNEKRKRYEIHKVMGPDEYHTHYPDAKEDEPGLNNNAYTNVMAVWVLKHAIKILDIFDKVCCDKLKNVVGFDDEEVDRWEDITKKMYIPFKDNIILQFEGYEKLKELDWEHYYNKYKTKSLRLDRILESEGDSCNYYKASKQADVIMLFYLFSKEELTELFENLKYNFKPEYIPENIDYYRKRTAHGSTLSQVIHAWVYARSHRDKSWKHFKEALISDFKDVQGGTTHEGIHLGAMAGTTDLIHRCYSGLEIRDDVLWFNPKLPDDIKEMSFFLRYRGHWMKLHINHDKLEIQFDKGWANPVTIGVNGKTHLFETNDKKVFNL